ncbi:DUF3373 domain-containing protein [Sulfurovum sp. XGS-02]|uniref:DUF3373 family protein n=1 Tax=Sulfurovum sp. XGS-02 TaxID=2925411 RepID=UPI002054CEB1|nr:DUF3373 family protein [Sulfurovum sp. XGS-02]UPT77595.1 DUF3373 domain-containing protein [Sulfurovum sp. XGS-02]
MKKIVTASLVATLALTTVNASSVNDRITDLEAQLAKLQKKVKKQNKKINEVKAHDSGDNIKWGVDLRTSIDNINYDMADGTEQGKNDLMATRLWLNMAYAPNANNVFKGQLSYNKAFGADLGQTTNDALNPFGMRGFGFDTFNWFSNESLTNDNLKVRQAYWLYLGEKAFGLDMPWTFSVGRRPSTNGFLANLRDDDAAQSPLGHIINVEFDGLSSKLDLSKITGVPGMSFKLCMGQGATNAVPMLGNLGATNYANDDASMEDIKLAGFIFEPYNDGQYIVKTTAFRAYDLPGFDTANMMAALFDGAMGMPTADTAMMSQQGDIDGAAISVLVDGVTEDGYFADVKLFASLAGTKTRPDADGQMLGMTPSDLGFALPDFGASKGEGKGGHSYWFGAQLPVNVGDENYGKLGLEYNHGSKYWRPFDYAEDTMIGSKLAARGDAWEVYYTYQFNEALSAQFRYTSIDYDYTGSQGFFASGGTPLKIDDLKAMSTAAGAPMGPQAAMVADAMLPNVVEKAQDARFYIRYRF